MSELVERVRRAGSKDAWDKPMVTDSEARAIIEEVADTMDRWKVNVEWNEARDPTAGEATDWLRAQAQGESDGE